MSLDKSWKESLADGSLGKVYLLGAEDFQRKALEAINDFDYYGSKESFRDKILKLIQNLKYETKINSDS